MVKHEILPNSDGFSVHIYDAPAGGWRLLFGQKEGAIGSYTTYDDAMAGVQVYDRSDKAVLFEAEFEVYLKSARTGIALDGCGLPSFVRFGDPDHCAYATFNSGAHPDPKIAETSNQFSIVDPLRGVPGFWEDRCGVHLWKPKDYFLPRLIIPIEVEEAPAGVVANPWLETHGALCDDTTFGDWVDEIAKYRREVDEEESQL